MSTPPLQPGRATLFDIRTVTDSRGALSVVESGIDLPFEPRRLYYIYGSNAGQVRAGHAHRTECQCLIAVAGAVEIEIDNGQDRSTFRLGRPDQGLLLEPVSWITTRFRDAASVLCVLASNQYDVDDYIREYEEFRTLVRSP